MSFLKTIEEHGLLYQIAGTELEEHLHEPRLAYTGFDPTKDSLHIGNLIPMIMLRHWQDAGHTPIVVMGGGTGLIGDPSGKDAERQLLTPERVRENVAAQKKVFERVLDFSPDRSNRAIMVNNLDWLEKLGYIQVLRDVGKHFSVNVMITKDSVRDRLENRDQGISYTEFSYMILQAYDFLHLRREMNCTVQMSGSDQYGNIVAGMDLIRREFGAEEGASFGITAPLVMRADGKKMGKSEEGAVWLTAEHTSPYRFYQYWVNTPDENARQFLGFYTFLDREEIDAVMAEQEREPHRRPAQRRLAREVTTLLHGADSVERVEAASGALFGRGDVRDLDAEMLGDVFADVPSSEHAKTLLEDGGVSLVDVLIETTLAPSKRQAREFLGNGAVFVNGETADADRKLSVDDLLHGRTILLRRGKKNWHATSWG